MKLFSIQDMKAESFNRPFHSVTRATAMREVSTGLQQDEAMQVNAADFALYEIGSFDPITGRLTAQDPYHVCDVRELVANHTEGPHAANASTRFTPEV